MNEPTKRALTILLINDDEIQLHWLRIIVELGGFHVVRAQSVDEALTSLNQNAPDLIMMDYWIGEVNGIEMCNLIRKRPDTYRTPIIMLCVGNKQPILQQAIEAGINTVLWMPFDPKEIISTIESLIS